MALVGTGSALPLVSVSNEQLSRRVDTNDAWIRSRTGITARRVAGPGETITSLATAAAQAALEQAGWAAEDLDLILLATSSPDDLFGTAPRVQGALGARRAAAFDLTAACSGFLFALITAGQYIRGGTVGRALVIGADQLSRWIDWDDRSTCVLFGDGAAAVAVEACEEPRNGLLGFKMHSDGRRADCLSLRQRDDHVPLLEGHLSQKGGDAVADRFAIPHERVLSNLARYGNTSAATIPLMLDEAVRDGRVRPGDLIASSGFGAGLSWGAALLRWGGPGGGAQAAAESG
ncbi:MAG: 3-oxoacyl-ACP synthase [Cyanobacteria bacterium]|nr:3-oxoacyl-ACP synthase [Cyanobacteriota bacterium]